MNDARQRSVRAAAGGGRRRRYKNIAVEDDKQIQALVASQARAPHPISILRRSNLIFLTGAAARAGRRGW